MHVSEDVVLFWRDKAIEEKKPQEECTGPKGRKALHSLEFKRNMYVEYVEPTATISPTKDQIWLVGDVHSRDMIGPRHRRWHFFRVPHKKATT